jgi:hypothetical protein
MIVAFKMIGEFKEMNTGRGLAARASPRHHESR